MRIGQILFKLTIGLDQKHKTMGLKQIPTLDNANPVAQEGMRCPKE